MQLTKGDFFFWPMGNAIDNRPAHAAYTFPAVMIKGDRVFAFLGEFFIQYVKHLEKRHIGTDRIESVGL